MPSTWPPSFTSSSCTPRCVFFRLALLVARPILTEAPLLARFIADQGTCPRRDRGGLLSGPHLLCLEDPGRPRHRGQPHSREGRRCAYRFCLSPSSLDLLTITLLPASPPHRPRGEEGRRGGAPRVGSPSPPPLFLLHLRHASLFISNPSSSGLPLALLVLPPLVISFLARPGLTCSSPRSMNCHQRSSPSRFSMV